MRTLVLLALFAGASLACQDATEPGGINASSEASDRAHLDLREERASLIAAGNALSDAIGADGEITAFGAALASNALFLSPRTPVLEGRAAALSFLSSNPVAPSAISWEVIVAEVSNDATQGFTWSQGAFTINLGAGPTELPGFFLIYWQRSAGGDWQIAAISINAGGPQTGGIPDGFGTPDNKHRRNFPNTEVTEQRDQLLDVDAAFSAASVSDGTGPAFAAYAASNAIAVGDGQLIFGPEAIGTAFTTGPNDVVSWVPRFSDVAASGDLGFTVGDATFVFADFGTFYTKYLTVWQKQNTGEWKFRSDFGSSRPAPSP
jgi:ketosteroid isomerase-like protein